MKVKKVLAKNMKILSILAIGSYFSFITCKILLDKSYTPVLSGYGNYFDDIIKSVIYQ